MKSLSNVNKTQSTKFFVIFENVLVKFNKIIKIE